MKAAVAVWDGRISPVFDVSREAAILTIENGILAAQSSANIETPAPGLKAARLVDLGIDTLICGAISEPLRADLANRGVRVVAFVAGDVGDVVRAFLAGELPATGLSMPGCAGRHARFRRGRPRRSGRERGVRMG
jgi:predicted Fe-Mo cluster-binding NifX family protein